MRRDTANNPQRSWVVSGRLQSVSIQVSGDNPEIRTYVEEFLMPLAGMDGHAPLDVLEFHLNLYDGEPDRAMPSGSKALIQFSNVSCFKEGTSFSFHTKDGSFLKVDVEAGRTWGLLSKELLGAPRYVFTDLLMAPLMEMLKHRGFFGLHAAALVRDGAGYLLPGGAGSGKTTVALSLLKEGFRYLADDKVLLRNRGNGIEALAFTRRFNVDPDIGQHFSELSFLEDLQPLPGSIKRPLDISSVYTNTFVPSCRPTVLIHLQRTPLERSRIHQLSTQESFSRLIQQTIPSMQKDITKKQLKLFADLAQGTESFLLDFGMDLYGAPNRLVDLLPPS